ncbi:MAG: Uma2 family endonuclease [Hyphomicrobiaceae bacterium]
MSVSETAAAPRLTVREFLEAPQTAPGRHELVNGVVRAMSPASSTHAIIQANLAGLIWQHLRTSGRPCRVGTEAPVVPHLHANDNVRAPDLAVTCSPSVTGRIFPEPVLIIEVLSPSNQRETWESIWACATIPSLVEIAVVDSDRQRVEVFRRDERGNWPKTSLPISTGGAIELKSIGATFVLADVYAGTPL